MTKDIYQALNEVMKQVGYVQKTRSGGINYSYAGEAALIAAVRPHCVEQGIVIHPHEVKEIHQDTYATKSGAVMNRALVVMIYRITHAPTGSFIDVTVTGEGADIGDKTFNKALTGAYKYALRQTLMIETGDDPDRFPSEPQEAGDKKNGKAPKRAATSNGETNGNEPDESATCDAEQVKEWRDRLARAKNITVGTLASILANACPGRFNHEKHAVNWIHKNTDLAANEQVDTDAALEIYDKATGDALAALDEEKE